MAHGEAIAHGDGIDLKGDTTGAAHPGLDGLGNLSQVHVPGDNISKTIDNSDKRLLDFSLSTPQSIEQRPVRRSFNSPFDNITFHAALSPFAIPD